jgi:O-antigen ligase
MFAISSSLCGLIIILDWILINLFSVGFRKYFVSVDYKTANMLYYQKEYFTTVGGVAEEPGSMALLMNIIFPLGLLYLKLKGKYWRFALLMGVYALSSFFIFSAAGIIAVSIAFGSVFVLNLVSGIQRLKIRQNPFIAFCFISVFVVGFALIDITRNIDVIERQGTELKQKITFSEQNVSADTRIETWKSAIENWETSPIWGNGPGDGVKRSGSGYHSVYLTLLADAGLFSVLLFLFFLVLQFFKLRAVPSEYRVYVFIALFSTVMHFSIVGDFYHAPFWILLILINLMLGADYPKK